MQILGEVLWPVFIAIAFSMNVVSVGTAAWLTGQVTYVPGISLISTQIGLARQCIGSACSSTTENLGVLPWAATFWLMVAAVVLLGVGSLTAAAAYYDWIMTRPARVLVFLAELCVTLSVLLYPIGFSTYFSGGTYATTGAAAYQLPSAWALGYSFYLAAASLAVLLLAEIARVALRERSENDVIDALLFD